MRSSTLLRPKLDPRRLKSRRRLFRFAEGGSKSLIDHAATLRRIQELGMHKEYFQETGNGPNDYCPHPAPVPRAIAGA